MKTFILQSVIITLFCSLAHSQTGVIVQGVTPTQVSVAYTAPNSSACTLALSTSNTLSPLVVDLQTDAGGANDLARASTVTNGLARVVVIGKRNAVLSTINGYNNQYVSNALTTNTQYFGSVTCGGSPVTFGFTTMNVPLGLGYGDPFYTDPSNPGVFAAPSDPGIVPNFAQADPQTGLSIQHATYPGFGYVTGTQATTPGTSYNQGQVVCDTVGPWTTPCNANTSSGYASVTNSTDWLVVRPDNIIDTTGHHDWGQLVQSCINNPQCAMAILQQQINMNGWCSSAITSLCTLDVALSMNMGGNTATKILSNAVTLPCCTSGSAAVVTTPATISAGTTGIDPWIYDSSPKITSYDAYKQGGCATVSGNIVTRVGTCTGYNNGSGVSNISDFFSFDWLQSGRIRLSTVSVADACLSTSSGTNAEAVITGTTGQNSLTLATSPGNTYTFFCGQGYSIMIRRHTADAGSSVNIQGVTASYVSGLDAETPSQGLETTCSHTIFSGGYLCMTDDAGASGWLTWYNPSNGTASIIGQMQTNAKTSGSDQWASQVCPYLPDIYMVVDDTASIPTWYCVVQDTNSKWVVLETDFGGTYTTNNNFSASASIGSGAATVGTYTLTYPANSVTISDLTPGSLGMDILSLANAYLGTTAVVPAAQPLIACVGAQVQQGNLLVRCYAGVGAQDGQNTMQWLFVISPGDHNPAHAGTTGAHIIAALNTWQYANSRFSGVHGTEDYGQASPYLGYGVEPIEPGDQVIGDTAMYVTTNSEVPGNSASAAPQVIACPTNSLGVTAPDTCVQLQINPATGFSDCTTGGCEPYYWTSKGLQGTAPGVPAVSQVGDFVCISTNQTGCGFRNATAQVLQLIQKGVGGDPSQWIFRLQYPNNGNNPLLNTTLKYIFFLPSNYASTHAGPEWPGLSFVGGLYSTFTNSTLGCYTLWPYATDPLGQNTIIDPQAGCVGHGYTRTWSVVQDNNGPAAGSPQTYWARYGSTFAAVLAAPNALVTETPVFDGLTNGPSAMSGWYQSHPGPSGENAISSEQQAFFDVRPLVGAATSAPAIVYSNVGGNVWVETFSGGDIIDADDFGNVGLGTNLNRKIYATNASSGPHPLVDISGPSSNICNPTCATTTAPIYTYCIPRVIGECNSGSALGSIYVNVPGIVIKFCFGDVTSGLSQDPQANDVCITNAVPVMQGVVQASTQQNDPNAAYQRVLTHMVGPPKQTQGQVGPHLMPDNSWVFFPAPYLDGNSRSNYIAKLPPYPSVDSFVRNAFIPIAVNLTAPTGLSVTNAIITFGYLDYNGNCTTRNDPCIANAATIPSGTAPFLYASESPTGLACTTSCTITIPAISERMLYYTASFRNASNVVVATNPTIIEAVEPMAPITLSPSTLPNGTVGIAYSQAITPSGGTGPYTCDVTVGSIPAGTTQTGTGNCTISGIPTTATSYGFTMTATDSLGNSGGLSYSVTIAPPTIIIAPNVMPTGIQGTLYAQSLGASGGIFPYTYSLTVGSLPPGLFINFPTIGVISGTPTSTGTTNFTVTAVDSHGNTGTQAYSITITAPAVALGTVVIGSTATAGITQSGVNQPSTWTPLHLTQTNNLAPTFSLFPSMTGVCNVAKATSLNCGTLGCSTTSTPGCVPAQGYQGGVYVPANSTYPNGEAIFNPWQQAQSTPIGQWIGYTGGPSGTFHCSTSAACSANWEIFDSTSLVGSVVTCTAAPCPTTATAAGYVGNVVFQPASAGGPWYYFAPDIADIASRSGLAVLRYNGQGLTNPSNWQGFLLPCQSATPTGCTGFTTINANVGGATTSPSSSGYGWCGLVYDGRYVYYVPTHGGPSTNRNVIRFDTGTSGTNTFVITNFSHVNIGAFNSSAGGYLSGGYDGGQYVYFLPTDTVMARYNSNAASCAGGFTSSSCWSFFSLANLGTGGNPQVTGNGNLASIQNNGYYVGAQMVWDAADANEYMYMDPFQLRSTLDMQSNVIRIKVGTCSGGTPGQQTCTGTFTPIDVFSSGSTWEIFDLANLASNQEWAIAGLASPPVYGRGSTWGNNAQGNQLVIGGFQLGWINTSNIADPKIGMVADNGAIYSIHDVAHTLSDPTGWTLTPRPSSQTSGTTNQVNGCMGGAYDYVDQTLYVACPAVSPIESMFRLSPM